MTKEELLKMNLQSYLQAIIHIKEIMDEMFENTIKTYIQQIKQLENKQC